MKPTSAGLFPSSGVLWSWSDWATDESGFEYATVVAISPSTSSAKIIDDRAYPDDMAASPAGLYYETVVGTKNHLVRATANGGRELPAPTTDSDAPLALGPGYLAVFAMKGAGLPYVDEFSANTLAVLHSSRLAVNTSAVLGTTGGVTRSSRPVPATSARLRRWFGSMRPTAQKRTASRYRTPSACSAAPTRRQSPR